MRLTLYIRLALLLLVGFPSWSQAQTQGSILWARQLRGQYDSEITHMKIDAAGNVYVTGTFIDLTDFDLSNANFSKMSGVYQDVFVAKYGPTGNLHWVSHFDGGSNIDNAIDMELLPGGGVTVTGLFELTIDADPGPGQVLLSSPMGKSIFMVTLDAAGQHMWSYSWNAGYQFSSFSTQSCATALTPSGNIILVGHCTDLTDINPTAAVQLAQGTQNFGGAFLVEMDPLGGIVRATSWTWVPTKFEEIEISSTGRLAIAGTTFNTNTTLDVDPSPGVFLASVSSDNAILATIDLSTLALLDWKRLSGVLGGAYSRGLTMDQGGTVCWSVSFDGTVDINPDIAIQQDQTAVWGEDAVLYAINPLGNVAWTNLLAGNGDDIVDALTYDPAGNLFLGGTLHGTTDLDPSPGQYNLTSSGNRDGFLAKWTANGQFLWAQQVGTMNDDYGGPVALDANGDVYMAGRFIGNGDFDPGTAVYGMQSTGIYDAFIAKYSQVACSNFGGYFGAFNGATCNVSGNATFFPVGGTAPYSYVWDDNSTSASISTPVTATRHVTITDAGGCVSERAVHFTGPPTGNQYDLEVNCLFIPARAGVVQTLAFRFRNATCIPANAQLVVRFDTAFSMISPAVAPDSVVGQDYYFNLGMLTYSPTCTSLLVNVMPSNSLIDGDRLAVNARIYPEIGDLNPPNNLVFDTIPVMGAYDPNDIRVLPAGACAEKYLDSDEDMTYLVRFQNTGSAEAYDIYVLDSLDPALDLSTFRVIDYSHPMLTEVLPGNVLKFRFDGIMLPDSNSNEPASHGHFSYTIRANAGTPDGTLARNRADIYFDFNPPVLTNTTQNTLVQVVPACEGTTGIPAQEEALRVYPNPSAGTLVVEAEGLSQVEVYDLGGRKLWQGNAEAGMARMDLSRLPRGVYVLKALVDGRVEARRVVLE